MSIKSEKILPLSFSMLKYSTKKSTFIFKPSTLTQTIIPKTVLSYNWVATGVVVVWRNGSGLVSINEVNRRQARLVLGWVTRLIHVPATITEPLTGYNATDIGRCCENLMIVMLSHTHKHNSSFRGSAVLPLTTPRPFIEM